MHSFAIGKRLSTIDSNAMKRILHSLKPGRIVTGAIVIYVALSIGIGSFVGAGELIILSLICTAGISLIIWIPSCWLVGFITLTIFDLCRRLFAASSMTMATASAPGEATTNTTVSNDILAIATYITKSRKREASDSQIRNRLKTTGWSEKEIDGAFDYLATNTQGQST